MGRADRSTTSVSRWNRLIRWRGAEASLTADGLILIPEPGATCCYARQDKIWVQSPDGVDWEFYTVLEHIETW